MPDHSTSQSVLIYKTNETISNTYPSVDSDSKLRPPRTMAEEAAQENGNTPDIESKVRVAMSSRVAYFRDQADSLTFEGVRRLLEKDLGLEIHGLDVHKRFVKKCLQECLEADNDDQVSKDAGGGEEKTVSSGGGAESLDELEPKKDVKEPDNVEGEKMEDSPVMGLMTRNKETKMDPEEGAQDISKVVPNEMMIKKAVKNRVSHFRSNSENITYSGARRLLEEDLKLEKYALDSFKKFISEQVDAVLKSPAVRKAATVDRKKNLQKGNSRKASTKSRNKESSDDGSSGSDSDENEEEEVKPRKKDAVKGKSQNSEGIRKRKRAEEVAKGSRKKQVKAPKVELVENSDADEGGDVSDGGNSESSAEKPVKKKETPKPVYGKRVEQLKSVIKSCGIIVPPVIYKKVKQEPEIKREASLIKELEEILAKEGLSTNPSEKEIKEVKKRKERAKEMEGIDMSNIVSSSRRRSTASYAPPPKPQMPIESDESGDSDDEDDEEDDEEEQAEEQGEEDDGGNDSQSEEEHEDDGGSD